MGQCKITMASGRVISVKDLSAREVLELYGQALSDTVPLTLHSGPRRQQMTLNPLHVESIEGDD